jgi:hypothetical protein
VDPNLFAVWRYSPARGPALATVLDDRALKEAIS